jgi:hypothetical protein
MNKDDPPFFDASRPREGRYANYVEIGHNAGEFLLDFGQLYGGLEQAVFHTRIVTSPICAKALNRLLGDSIGRYEQAYGVIEGR